MIYNLDIQINEKPHDTYNAENSYTKNYDNTLDVKNFNYKEIDNIIFAPHIKKENEFIFFRKTLEIFKTEFNDAFNTYYNNLSNEEKKNLREIVEVAKESQ